MRFEAQKVIFTSILDAEDQWIMAKIRFYTNFPITLQNKQKMVFFDEFSTFLQGLRYCLGYQTDWMKHISRVLDAIRCPESDFHIHTRCWKSVDYGQNTLLHQFSHDPPK